MLGNSNFGIITLTCNLRYELLDKSFSISVLYLINFLILCTLNQVDFTGIQAPIYKSPHSRIAAAAGALEITFSEITYDRGRYVQLRPSAALLSGR